jgi:predicted homoserine dehydrogenase-like protein
MKGSTISRREFIHAAAGAAGASVIGGPGLLRAESIAAQTGSTSPSDRVRFGIIGVGMEGSGLLTTAIQLPNVECVAAADLWDPRHELAKEIVGKPIRTTRRYQDLLDAKDIDAVIIAVPDHWHKQTVVDAI